MGKLAGQAAGTADVLFVFVQVNVELYMSEMWEAGHLRTLTRAQRYMPVFTTSCKKSRKTVRGISTPTRNLARI